MWFSFAMVFISEKLQGIVQRVTYHNPATGWSVLRVQSYANPGEQLTVTVHQTRVFAGATMEFRGAWTVHPQFGRQFKATEAIEKKPASAAALEKYLGSGLIKGVGPKTARRIVQHFKGDTLRVFEEEMDRLTEVPGIARKKLEMIEHAWREHRMVRDVMIFLQGHGISTLFAVRIFQKYGERAIELVSADPYRLAVDFYGIGFFSADKVALSIGLAPDSDERIRAAIRHVLAASREQGHCYLTAVQIRSEVEELLTLTLNDRLERLLRQLEEENQLKVRLLAVGDNPAERCYYSKSLYYDEETVARRITSFLVPIAIDHKSISGWIEEYCQTHSIALSAEQADAVAQVVSHRFSVLTGGPGCGKTTTTLVIVRLLEALHRRVLLAAPTGRAAQRMGEVIGREAKTLHRLLEWQGEGFQRNKDKPLQADFLIVDECSMLDVSLSAALLSAVPDGCQVLFIGDADQLPSVGAGNVLRDIIGSEVVPCFRLTQVFRQARESKIIGFAHQINRGETPHIESPFKRPEVWRDGTDCLFLDSDEPTNEQLDFVARVKRTFNLKVNQLEGLSTGDTPYEFRTHEAIQSPYEKEFMVPAKFQHVDLQQVARAEGAIDELKSVLKKVHPWSTLHYNLTAVETVVKLYLEWIPKYLGRESEIQILSPMTRGSLGTANLNQVIQQAANPPAEDKPQLQVGERIFRVGDRVIHRRNNYELAVFNGDIGTIRAIDTVDLTCMVSFFPDGREVLYQQQDIMELDLAYAITIHKSQGSEFKAVILPVLTQHFKMLYRNLIYTGLTRARELAVFVGTRRAMGMAIRQQDTARRQTALATLLRGQL
ncbi:SF1B family DNA helicase RecD2 [Desulfopila aestuarii]|uniref:Exodeoxyribonuclease V alpha subunit n=1 Tax=Desulfopila aestuarii DSM 18488 TaxID=1121416 RepID=A0A1M7Y6E9_9BACT|nr:exodeoxyribonuclease V alpha subunit [Desulfopila aestuarii DSM 18488]